MDKNIELLQTELATAYSEFSRVIEQLGPDKRERSGVSGHWSPKDVVAHLIGWDKSLQEFITDPAGFNPAPLYETDNFNAASVSGRERQSWDETRGGWQHNYRDLQKALTRVTPEMKIYTRVTEWLKGRRDDYEHHTRQMEEWIDTR